jgi:inosine-uridine nucleoside N-ribohydrolase
VEVEYDQGLTRGTTVVDVHGVTGNPPNTHVALDTLITPGSWNSW